jgi:hypothetical protein
MFLSICGCCDGIADETVTLRSFSTSDGSLVWQRRLDNPVMSPDGFAYGYHLIEEDSAASNAAALIRLSGFGAGAACRVTANPAVPRYKKRVRKINATTGAIAGDSALWWYTDNNGSGGSPIELPPPDIGWQPDMFGANSDGWLLQMQANNSTGAFTYGGETLIVWDSGNTTTTRRYTFAPAAVRDLASVPTGGTKMRFVVENDGTNSEQTIDVANMIGKTGAALASDLAAFPHIVSATGTGGPYPFEAIDLEIEWSTSTYHFLSVQRLSSTSRSFMTWARDWDSGEIVATLADPGSNCDQWQFADDDSVIGIAGNPQSSVGSPAQFGVGVERYTESTGAYSRVWRTRPTLDRYPIWGANTFSSRVRYTRPATRGGKLIVGHETAQEDGQSSGDHSEWCELSMSTGAIVDRGGANNRWHVRPVFASDSQLFTVGWDSFQTNSYVGTNYSTERPPVNYHSLSDSLAGYDKIWRGAYAPVSFTEGFCTADTTALYGCRGGGAQASVDGYAQSVIYASDTRIMTIYNRFGSGVASRVSPDSFFSLGNYYRIQYFTNSPIAHCWNSSGMEWRFAFFNTLNITASSAPVLTTSWLSFTADEADLLTALSAVLGVNDAGANAFVSGPTFPVDTIDGTPLMIWQRGLTLTFPSDNVTFPPTTPAVVWNLNNRDVTRYGFVQVRAAVAGEFFVEPDPIMRVEWDGGDVTWARHFGTSVSGGGPVAGTTGLIYGSNYVVSGDEVTPDS